VIDKAWIRQEVTVEEVEKITILDLEGIDEASVVDKGNWWKESIYRRDLLWHQFKKQLQEGDKIHKWVAPLIFVMSGFVIVRNGEPVYMYTNSPR
jgi:hypothetical protein